jgi:hypothetical protein
MGGTDAAGLVLSAASLAIQLGELGRRLTKTSRNNGPKLEADDESLALAIRHECRQTNLLSNVLCTRNKFGLAGTVLEEMPHLDREVSVAILNRLFRLWSECEQLQSEMAQEPRPQSIATDISLSILEEGRGVSLDEVQHVVCDQNRDQLVSLIENAAKWNARLERTVRNFSWTRSLSAQSPEETVHRLRTVAEDGEAEALNWSTPARLREITLAIGNSSIDRSNIQIPDLQFSGDVLTGRNIPSSGIIQTILREGNKMSKALVEYLPYKKQEEGHEDKVLRRVEQLATLLHLEKIPTFRLPLAYRFYKDEKRSRFGILFKLESLTPYEAVEVSTLHMLFRKSPDSRPSLGLRFQLAYKLAHALSDFQSIGWVHQGYRSENVLFLSQSGMKDLARDVPYAEPLLFGYGGSRLDSLPSASLYDDDPDRNLYRHPGRWGVHPAERFNKLHDIYSLGVVLLEIGYWACITELVGKEYRKKGADPSIVRQQLLDLAANPRIANLVGEVYGGIAALCLRSTAAAFGFEEARDDKNDSLLQQRFSEMVVLPLKKATDALLV